MLHCFAEQGCKQGSLHAAGRGFGTLPATTEACIREVSVSYRRRSCSRKLRKQVPCALVPSSKPHAARTVELRHLLRTAVGSHSNHRLYCFRILCECRSFDHCRLAGIAMQCIRLPKFEAFQPHVVGTQQSTCPSMSAEQVQACCVDMCASKGLSLTLAL